MDKNLNLLTPSLGGKKEKKPQKIPQQPNNLLSVQIGSLYTRLVKKRHLITYHTATDNVSNVLIPSASKLKKGIDKGHVDVELLEQNILKLQILTWVLPGYFEI